MMPEPDPVIAARICEAAGAHGITIHLREDRRHIHDRDVRRLRSSVRTRINLEMSIAPEIVRIACATRPDITCIVPERREEVTTEGGLDVAGNCRAIARAIDALHARKIPVSLFIAPDLRQVRAATEVRADFIELHTGSYANARGVTKQQELTRLVRGAEFAHTLGLRVNAGHGITLENIAGILKIPHLCELNIGHSIISRAVFIGLERAVREMLAAMKGYKN